MAYLSKINLNMVYGIHPVFLVHMRYWVLKQATDCAIVETPDNLCKINENFKKMCRQCSSLVIQILVQWPRWAISILAATKSVNL